MYILLSMIEGDKSEDERDDEREGRGCKETSKEDNEKDVKKLVVEVIVLGLFLIGVTLLFKSSILFQRYEDIPYIIRGLGISIIGGALIAWAIGHLISKRNFLKLFKETEDILGNIRETDGNIKRYSTETLTNISETDGSLRKHVTETFELIKECWDNGLLKIYEPYDMKFKSHDTNRVLSNDFTEEVKNMIVTEEEEIKICGLSLRLFFNSDHGKFFNEIRNAFTRMGDTGKPIVKILMLHPQSPWKELRQSVEDKFTTPRQKLETNLDESIEWLDDEINQHVKNKDKIMDNIRFYDATPDFFLFITSQCIIFEIYHMGFFQLDKERNRDTYCLGLGGHVPALKFDSHSPMYGYLNAHFDYYFEKEIDGKPNRYHKGTLKDYLQVHG